jgi:hypothetical protein
MQGIPTARRSFMWEKRRAKRIARRSGVSYETVQRALRGEVITEITAQRIASRTGLTVEQLKRKGKDQ